MMKIHKLFILYIGILLLSSCNKEDTFISEDLRQYYKYKDRIGGTALKSVPRAGSVEWRFDANLWHSKYGDGYLLSLSTSSPYYAFVEDADVAREVLAFDFEVDKVLIKDYSVYLSSDWKVGSPFVIVQYHRYLADGDVSGGTWNIDPTKDNKFKITGIDQGGKTCTGEFELYFIRNDDFWDFNYRKDTRQFARRINFLNGKFTAKIAY